MKSLVNDVTAFHLATGTPVLSEPQTPSKERLGLRHSLIEEEVVDELLIELEILDDMGEESSDLTVVADGIIDSIYVLVGTGIELGLPMQALWDEVQRANMSKAIEQPDGTFKVVRREDGKVIKPEGWTPPDIRGVLIAHGWQPPA